LLCKHLFIRYFTSFSGFFINLDYSISSIFAKDTHTRIFNNTVD